MCEISVIVPIYNGEKTIERCVESLINQTFKDLEIILVNDGSQDRSLNICKELSQRNKFIKVFTQNNKGQSAARNLGIKNSSGKYIMFCDCDDTVSNKWCENLYEIIKNKKEVLPYCGFKILDDGGKFVKKIENKETSKWQIEAKDFFYLDQIGLSGFPTNKIFYKEVLVKNNILFDENLKDNEDLKFVLEYVTHIKKIVYTNSQDYNYYSYENSISKYYRNKIFEKWESKYILWKQFLKKIDFNNYDKNLELCASLYLYYFLISLQNSFDSRNSLSKKEKYQYNKKIINSENFQECIRKARNYKDDKLYLKILKLKNIYIYYLFKYIQNIKNK